MQRLPRGRAVRGRTVRKIVKAFQNASKERLTPLEIKRLTGIKTNRTVTNAIKEMIENGGIIRVTTDNWPPRSYYLFVESLPDDRIEALEEEYERLFEENLLFMNPIKRLELQAIEKGLQFIKDQIENPPRTRFRTISPNTILAMKKGYYKMLNRAIDGFQGITDEAYRDDNLKIWEKCANCVNCKRVERFDNKKCLCTREWLTGNRPHHELGHHCDFFKIRMPKN